MLLYWRRLELLGIINNFPCTYFVVILILTVQNEKGSKSNNDPKQSDNKGKNLQIQRYVPLYCAVSQTA